MHPRITDQQRHILELLNTDWQIGTGHNRTWIQQGGAGRGGKTETLLATDINALTTQRLIYLSRQSFPTSTMDITEAGQALLAGTWTDEIHQKVHALLNDKGVPLQSTPSKVDLPPTEHPSYGQISIHHISGGSGALYGASVPHTHRIKLEVRHSSIHREDDREHYSEGRSIVAVEMSYDQFVGFFFNTNCSGTPCTLSSIGGEHIDAPQLASKRAALSQHFDKTIAAVSENMESLRAEASRILKTPGAFKAQDKDYLLRIMEKLCQDVSSNIPFIERQFQEQLDASVTEIEHQLIQRALQLGLDRSDGAAASKLLQAPAPSA